MISGISAAQLNFEEYVAEQITDYCSGGGKAHPYFIYSLSM